MANPESVSDPLGQLLRQALNSSLRGMMVCMPGKIVDFDPENQLAQIECGIQMMAVGRPVTYALVERVPVQFGGTAGWVFYHELPPGTEGIVLFSQRAMDTWLDQGGPVAPHDSRMFDLSDAIFIPGLRSMGNVIPDFPAEGAGIMNRDGAVHVSLSEGGIELTAGASRISITGSGISITSGSLTHNGVNVGSTHVHPQRPDSDGNTEQNTEAPQ